MQGSDYGTKKGSVADLAALLGLSARRMYQFAQDGMFKIDKGEVVLADAIQAFVTSLKNEQAGIDEAAAKADKERRIAEAQLKQANADIAKLELKELEGKMHRSEDVETVIMDMLFSVRSALKALPGRLAVDVAAADNAAEASKIIEREVHLLMSELSAYKYDPARFKELVRERRKWEKQEAEDEDSD